MKIKKIASAASVFIAMSLVLATEVQAGPTYGRGYPRFPEEGRYPEQTSCGADNFKKHEEVIRSWNGYNIQIQYFLSPNCGSYARMNFAPRACAVFLDRTLDPYYTYEWTFVAEESIRASTTPTRKSATTTKESTPARQWFAIVKLYTAVSGIHNSPVKMTFLY